MLESRVWGRFQRELEKEFYMERIENAIVPGFPDVYLMKYSTGVSAFIELKSRDTGHWVSRHQALWLRRYKSAGGVCAIITGAYDGPFYHHRVDSTYDWIEEIVKTRTNYFVLPSLTDFMRDLLTVIS